MHILWLVGLVGCSDPRVEDLQARVVALEAENAELKETVTDLEGRVAKMETSGAAGPLVRERLPPPVAPPSWLVEQVDGTWAMRGEIDLEQLALFGRAIPHRGPDGEIDGYRVSGIRRGSPGELLGFANGDVVLSIDGMPMSSLEASMEAYTAITKAKGPRDLTFRVVRRGMAVDLVVPIGRD